MKPAWILLALTTAALAAGCKSDAPSAGPTPDAAKAPADKNIAALEPPPMTGNVSVTPTFRWRLPAILGEPTHVTFTLAEAGTGEKPDAAGEKPLAIATGLHDTSPTALNPFAPPAGCVLTGDLREMKQLKGGTWHRWRIRAIGVDGVAEAEFYFKTRAN